MASFPLSRMLFSPIVLVEPDDDAGGVKRSGDEVIESIDRIWVPTGQAEQTLNPLPKNDVNV